MKLKINNLTNKKRDWYNEFTPKFDMLGANRKLNKVIIYWRY
jgi:hypothetical protein